MGGKPGTAPSEEQIDKVQDMIVLLEKMRSVLESDEDVDRRDRLAICYQSKYDPSAWRHVADVTQDEARTLIVAQRQALTAALARYGIRP